MCYTIVAFGTLTGVPIAGVIIGANGGAHWGVVIFTAVCCFCALACFVAIRIAKLGGDGMPYTKIRKLQTTVMMVPRV